MATTTPNFGWSVPTSSDLVKNGATAIETLGDSIDASLVDLKGGTTDQVLAKNSNTDMDFKWVTAGGGGGSGMTFIARTSFSNVASQAFDAVFTSTYKNYLVVIENIYGTTTSDDLQFQFRYAGPTTATDTGYYGSSMYAAYNSGSVANTGSNGTTQFTMADNIGIAANSGAGFFYVTKVGNSSDKPAILGQYVESAAALSYSFSCVLAVSRTYTGFLLKSSSSNITGVVSIYGLAAA
jgi:hypothetical protein